ncbi:MAG: 30S ribosomal protein S4 [Nanohaloarchaea archaeon]|nr:30S ribosomal protein S4 [Candidatus Nanohaloarchaea archaeon]
MGDPRKSKRIFSRPTRPYDKDRITAEKGLMKEFGLRRKNEIYKAEAFIRDIKRRARQSIALKDDDVEQTILNKVTKLRLLGDKEATIDAILDLDLKHYLERRLETQVVRRELANSFLQARQFIVHGHIFVNNVKVTSPQYLVCLDEDSLITYSSKSVLASSFKYAPKKIKERKEFSGSRRPFGGRGRRPPFRGGAGNAQQGAPTGGVKK